MSAGGEVFDLLTDSNLGAMVVGLAVSLVLFGATIVQGYTYFQCFSGDRLFLKLLAASVLILELVHSCLITYTIYRNMVTLKGFTPTGPNSYPMTASIVPEVLITALVQGFFAFRIYRLSGTLHISVFCWALSLLRLGAGLALTIEGFIDVPKVPDNALFAITFGWLIFLVFTVGACVDVLIAASLCYWLKRLAPGEQLKGTSELIDRLFLWIIQTGMITSIVSVAAVVLFHTKRYTEIWFAVYMVTAKLYSNSFFVSLNVRHQLRNKSVVEINVSGLRFQDNLSRLEITTAAGAQE